MTMPLYPRHVTPKWLVWFYTEWDGVKSPPIWHVAHEPGLNEAAMNMKAYPNAPFVSKEKAD